MDTHHRRRNPLEIPEFFLRSQTDLTSAAHVSRSWVTAAQRQIFQVIRLVPGDVLSGRLLAVLDAAPHLVGYISELDLGVFRPIAVGNLEKLAELPYTKLKVLRVDSNEWEIPEEQVTAIGRLLRISTLVEVIVHARFSGLGEFSRMWPREGRIRNVGYNMSFKAAPSTTGAHKPRIQLETLSAAATPSEYHALWLHHVECPFDLPLTEGLLDALRGSLQTIGLISLLTSCAADIHLSRFTNVTALDIHHYWNGWYRNDFNEIRSMVPELRNRIRAIRFQELRMNVPDLHALHEELLSVQGYFPELRTVTINFHTDDPGHIEALRDGLRAHNWSLGDGITLTHSFEWEGRVPWYAR
ncbi:hypothetical protein FB45DRAFT_900232, partial [Roridomyces roridus]